MEWIKVKKKPIQVMAFELTEDMIRKDDFILCTKAIIEKNGKTIVYSDRLYKSFYVKTLEGTMKGKVGDYVIQGIKGELYICDRQIFKETYEILK